MKSMGGPIEALQDRFMGIGDLGGAYRKMLGAVPFLSFLPKTLLAPAYNSTAIILGGKERKLLVFMEGLGRGVKFLTSGQFP